MLQFIYENYELYPLQINNYEFYYQNYLYRIVDINEDEKLLSYANDLVSQLEFLLNKEGIKLVKNKRNEYLSFYQNTKCVLLKGKKHYLEINDLIKIHKYQTNINYQLDFLKLKEKWIIKIDFLEKEILPSINKNIDNYENIYSLGNYLIGLCENAIQYLNDIILDYDPQLNKMVICNKRLKSYHNWIILNPLLITLDHSSRDLSEILKNRLISNDQIINLLNYYDYNNIEASLLIARFLFPTVLLDQFEELHFNQIMIDEGYLSQIYLEEHWNYVKYICYLITTNFQIRPLVWSK